MHRILALVMYAASAFGISEFALRFEYTGAASGISNLAARIDFMSRSRYAFGMTEIRAGFATGPLFDARSPDIPVSLLGTFSFIKPFTSELRFDIGACCAVTLSGPFRALSYHAGIVLSHDGENNALLRYADVRISYEYIATALSAIRIGTVLEMPFKLSVLLFEWRQEAMLRVTSSTGFFIEEALFFDLMSIAKANPLVVQLSDESVLLGVSARAFYNTFGAIANTLAFGGAVTLAWRF